MHETDRFCTAFAGHRLLAAGPVGIVALAVRRATEDGERAPLLVFDDATGHVVDLDLRGSDADIQVRYSRAKTVEPPRGRGRPKLGVVAREVTLLPRHWDWLAAQPGGASVTLRRLVDAARRSDGEIQQARLARERAYRLMSALAGDLPGFEEASRALFAQDRAGFDRQIAHWPDDVRDHVSRLAFPKDMA
ncbi:MAG TPA: DUF2239 family protein [Aliidongia sp.]|nr:DUF2239 family protein [Aliidongia sp.]